MSLKLKLDDIKKIIEQKGGKLLSTSYVNQNTKLEAICENGHLFNPTAKGIKKGTWCKVCFSKGSEKRRLVNFKPENLDIAKNIAISKLGTCLSSTYTGNTDKNLEFICCKGHKWITDFKSIQRGVWCPKCSGVFDSDKLVEINELAKNIASNYGGKLIDEIKIVSKKVKWQCKNEHEWYATFHNVKDNLSWCPYCNGSFSEEVCREYFETVFGKPFKKSRPEWLINDKTGSKLELDGFNEELKIAFEHQGIQHYTEKFANHNMPDIKYRDYIKQKLCKKMGIKLIIIPDIFSITGIDGFAKCIREQLPNTELPDIENIINLKDLKYKIFNNNNKNIHKEHKPKKEPKININYVKNVASANNVKCLSNEYINNSVHMDFKCNSCGNEWKSTYNNFQYRLGCPICLRAKAAEKRKKGIEVYQQAAISKGGKCLSTQVNSCYDKLEWECANGHRWLGRADLVKNGYRWCTKCKNNKDKIMDQEDIWELEVGLPPTESEEYNDEENYYDNDYDGD